MSATDGPVRNWRSLTAPGSRAGTGRCAVSQAATKSWPPWYSGSTRSSARGSRRPRGQERGPSRSGRRAERRDGRRRRGPGVSTCAGRGRTSVGSAMSLAVPSCAVAGGAVRVEDVGGAGCWDRADLRARRRRSGSRPGRSPGEPVTPSPTTGSSSVSRMPSLTASPGRNASSGSGSPSRSPVGVDRVEAGVAGVERGRSGASACRAVALTGRARR